MSDGAWLKFRYHSAVYSDPRLTLADKSVLGFTAIEFVHGDGDTFCRRQETVAARVGTNVRTVQRAYKRGLELGYLELITKRQRGRGHTRADEYRIQVPAGCAATPKIDDTMSGIPINSRHTVQEYPTLSPEIPDTVSAEIAPTSDDEPPKVFYKGLLGKDAAPPPPAPLLDPLGQPRCRKHFGVENPPDCPPCGLERERKETLDRFKADRIEAERRAIRAAIDSCPNKCDDAGRLDDLTDCPLHPNFRQKRDVA
ncbi:hypothetical protein [Mycobacteroides abscessus]|uniref:hypothetical protein n=1 Tax=Mycobacteroides abscessus TaxID=36809 RepID=UPI00092BCE3C|nr:hypothetical protein [Mycobacteroides abscessus]OLT76603.1 hypothetical protein BKG58_24495 [Mycobacteroides abscessus subsp. abscessus]SHQ41420.1 Uncharacterised protein [Mycobacteroides abscessus subsp. abscessus]SHS65201.1 Uncharacterised protein [Mycobacteroides abscessus subsp. abscessus]SHS66946.1 Uncharacterised protein [Mycobacteroides abscessus subsp. abscessus]SHS83220.1 Uncharacterised protein [Mycobacteroides abscessus subsp. abscessus]